jgi:L-ascorbate metabolism protein UlaG (beta-lactamase superfamily)
VDRLTGLRLERAQSSRQWRDGRFRNTSGAGPGLQGPSGSIVRDFLFGGRARRPRAALPVERPLAGWSAPADTGLRTTWLGHSTLLLELDGVRVLTDPVFGQRASPLSFAGPRRFHPAPASIDELPPLDLILLSHDHYDHLCAPSWRRLAALEAPVVTSLGVGARLERLGVAPARITELDWWEHLEVGGLRITATPSQHFSGRGLGDRNLTLWSSWVLESERRRIFFSGDTGPTAEFADIGRRFGRFDLIMLEIGAWHPAWGNIHLGPAAALDGFAQLGGGTLLPIHWGTFDLALHPWDEPADTLLSLAAPRAARVITPPLGRVVEPDRLEGATPWWRGADAAAVLAPASAAT